MVGVDTKVGEQQLFAAWVLTSAVRLHGYEDGVNILQRFGIACLQNPAFLANIVLVKDAEVTSLLFVRSSPSPRLKGACVANLGVSVQIVSIKNKPLPSGIENAPVRLIG